MNGINAVFDTNIVIYHMTGFSDVKRYFKEFTPVLSFITELEILSGPDIRPEQWS
jgi:predicted nucleic acid-binding protein